MGKNKTNGHFLNTKDVGYAWEGSQTVKLIPSGLAHRSVQFPTCYRIEEFQCSFLELKVLTHWGRVTHICVGNLTIIGSDNGLSSGRRQAIIGTDDGLNASLGHGELSLR